MSCRLSLVLRFFCFVFVFVLSLKSRGPSLNRSSFFDMHASRQPHVFVHFPFFLEMSLFPSIFLFHLPFSRCMESRSYVFPFRMVFFYLITTSWIYCISLLGDNSINNSINSISHFFSLYLVEEVFFPMEIFSPPNRLRYFLYHTSHMPPQWFSW